ncbi:MAG: class I SAM-dependent methyltransferase [Bacilli bacterium]
MKLSERLEAVASFIDQDNSIIDVGCDHALLDIYLIKNNMVKRAVASDNKQGPLDQAILNIKGENLENKIIVSRANGIDKLDDLTDTVVISGMGGLNMIGIMKYAYDKIPQIKKIVLSPNNEVAKVRKEFVELGYYIEKETLVKDHGVIYPVISFKQGKAHYKKKDYLFGPLLRLEKSPLFKELNEREIQQREVLLPLLPKKYWWRKLELQKEIKNRIKER